MPNGDTQDYVIKTADKSYRIRAPRDLPQDKVLSLAAATNPEFAQAYSQIQARQTTEKQAAQFAPSPFGGAYPTQQQEEQINKALPGVEPLAKDIRSGALATVGGSAGASIMGELSALRAGGAVLPKFVQLMARSAGAGFGGAAGVLAGTGSPKEAAKAAPQFSAMELGGEGVAKGFNTLARLWRADPARVADLGDLAKVEEQTRSQVQTQAPEIRKAINETYPKVDTPVRIMPAAKVAQKAEGEMVAESAPKQVSRLADIGRSRQEAALRLLSRARRVMESSPEGASDEVKTILDKAKSLQGIPFRDAQKLYSALGRAAAKGGGYKLSGEEIKALSDARDALEGSMHDALQFESEMERTAKATGVMPEGELGEFYRFRDSQTGGSFSVRKSEYSAGKIAEEAEKLRRSIPDTTQLDPLAQQKLAGVKERFEQWQPQDKLAQWEKAQAAHRQFVEDFYKPGGALTKIMDAAPDERGEVLKHILQDPKTRIRATEALKHYGFDTRDIMRLADKWRDPTELNRAIADAARLEQIGQEAFSGQEAAATRRAVGRTATKRLTQAAVGGGLYELYKMMQQRSPNLQP